MPQKLILCKRTQASTGCRTSATFAGEFSSTNTLTSVLVLMVHLATAQLSLSFDFNANAIVDFSQYWWFATLQKSVRSIGKSEL